MREWEKATITVRKISARSSQQHLIGVHIVRTQTSLGYNFAVTTGSIVKLSTNWEKKSREMSVNGEEARHLSDRLDKEDQYLRLDLPSNGMFETHFE